jgi:predicted O-methyltransferase YrrM
MSAHYFDEGKPATGKKVLLAMPTYDNPACAASFALARAREALHESGVQTALLMLQGNVHVDDARNSIVRDFLETDCTELVFLDADVTFEPDALVQLCHRDCDIVGGVYPYRREGSDHMPVRLMAGAECVDGLREVEGLPTGFMKIKRHVFEKMADGRPWFYDKVYPTTLHFDRPAPGDDHVRWGGDIDFCNRWRALGGKLYADEELRLGHVAQIVIYDSMGAHLRRLFGTTLSHIAPRIREGTETEADYNELARFTGNNYSADSSVLALVTGIARKCRGPILETGSGLTTAVIAAASGQPVHSLEHLEHYARQSDDWCRQMGVENATIWCAPLKDGWYDIERMRLPDSFTLGFCDGPPRLYGTRMRFLEVFGSRCSVIVMDDVKSDNNFSSAVRQWAADNGRTFEVLGRAALMQRQTQTVEG